MLDGSIRLSALLGLTAAVVIAGAAVAITQRGQALEQGSLAQASPQPTNVFGLDCEGSRLLSAERYTYASGGKATTKNKKDAAAKAADKKLKGYDSLADEPDGQVAAMKDGRKIARFRMTKLADGSFVVSRVILCPQDEVPEKSK